LEAKIAASDKQNYFGNDEELDDYCDTICQLDEYCSGRRNPSKPGLCLCNDNCMINNFEESHFEHN